MSAKRVAYGLRECDPTNHVAHRCYDCGTEIGTHVFFCGACSTERIEDRGRKAFERTSRELFASFCVR